VDDRLRQRGRGRWLITQLNDDGVAGSGFCRDPRPGMRKNEQPAHSSRLLDCSAHESVTAKNGLAFVFSWISFASAVANSDSQRTAPLINCARFSRPSAALHHDGALQHVYKRACALCWWIALDRPGACSTVIIRASLPGFSGGSLDMSDVTLGS